MNNLTNRTQCLNELKVFEGSKESLMFHDFSSLVLEWLYIHFCFMARFKGRNIATQTRMEMGLCGLSEWMWSYGLLCWRWLCD